MKWYLGIDGGGTKTAFAIGGLDGRPAYTLTLAGCSYQQVGVEAVARRLEQGIDACLNAVEARREDCAGCCAGLPCFGENARMDAALEALLEKALAPIPLHIVNDGVAGWAGSLECREGIHLVSGTGSIAVGCGRDGSFCRCGGWAEFFGDEGSCYWVGREAMSLFSKEADGRLPKSALYHIVREAFGLTNDFDFIDTVIHDLSCRREKVADFQRYALEAADAGDAEARNLYRRAARELALLASGVRGQLSWSESRVTVSYFGGLFHAEGWILEPLAEELAAISCDLRKPARTAAEGALLLAISHFAKEGKSCF